MKAGHACVPNVPLYLQPLAKNRAQGNHSLQNSWYQKMRLREDIEEVGGENMFLQQMIANHCGKFEYVVKTQNLKSPIQKLKLRAEI